MATVLNKLSARSIATIVKPGRHADGGGLYLQVGANGAKSWLFMFKREGKQREMGLGSLRDVRLAVAREKAAEARALLADGKDPLAIRRASTAAQADVTVPTFGEFADAYVDGIEAGFTNAKHRYQWKATLGDAYCAAIRRKPIDEVSTEDVLSILEPIWLTKSETASRLRGRIERVLDAAKVRKLRFGENPALWRGHLDKLLPKRRKLTRGHLKAMPYADVPAFMKSLEAVDGVSALALRFAILTAARSGEVLGAQWGEFDLEAKVWVVPRERMKARREHRVPLSDQALQLLSVVAPLRLDNDDVSAFVFPGMKNDKPLSIMAMSMVLRRLGANVTAHGFRSSFRDWAGEETHHTREIAEAALAHVVGNEVERAYRRGDALVKRRQLMADWAAFCTEGR
ncbi:tyrosine-type recombinase/integrase [Pseudoxanthobacter sp. M-2]|uniref:tyrosine-type recombinase/integrase n=1 Tax=Pseudoxanthobacter sp. M-2 TaxID=3078754 RepID=UPI0038FC08BD